MNPKLNSAQEIADFLGIKVDTLYHYARSGRIRAMKIGKAWKFSDEDLQSFLDSQRSVQVAAKSPGAAIPSLLTPVLAIGPGGVVSHGREVPYFQIDDMASRLAERLHTSKVRQGERVMVAMENSIELVVSCFATWKIGAVLVSENPATSPSRMEHAIRDAAPSALILDHKVWEAISKPLRGVKTVLLKGRTFQRSSREDASVDSLELILNQGNEATGQHIRFARPQPKMALAGSV